MEKDFYFESLCPKNLGCGGVMAVVVIMMLLLLSGCVTKEVLVSVPEQHTEQYFHRDSVHTTDSVITERETVVMMLDSAAMAQYGIQLKAAERAWLVKTKELEQRLRELASMKSDTVIVTDTVTIIRPAADAAGTVAGLTWWQQTRIKIANVVLWLLVFSGVFILFVIVRKFKP